MWRPGLRRNLVIAVAIAAIITLILLLPPVQTFVVKAVLGRVAAAEVGVGRVSAGPWGGVVEDLRVIRPGLELRVERAAADLAFWSSIGHLALDVQQATASGVEIRISPSGGARDVPSGEPVEFTGLGELARLPRRVILRAVDAGGTFTVEVSDELAVTGPWSLAATDVGPNRRLEGSLQSTLEVRKQRTTIFAADLEATLTADVERSGALRRAEAGGKIRSLGERPEGLVAGLNLELGDDPESYSLTVDGSGGHRVLTAQAAFDSAPRQLAATWEAHLTPGLVAAFARGRTLPDLWGRSSGSANVDVPDRRIEFETSSRFEGSGWGELDPRLVEVRRLVVEADASGVLHGGSFAARRLRIALIPESGREILHLEALQPVTLDMERWQAVPGSWGEPALRIGMDRFPLRWTRAFDPAVVVEDGAVSAALEVIPHTERHTALVSSEPIRAERLQFSAAETGEEPPRVDLVISPRMELREGTLEAAIDSFEMVSETGLRTTFTGGVATSRERWPVLGAEGDLQLVLPKLRQAVASLDAIRGGARFELDLSRMVLDLDRAVFDVTTDDGRSMVAVSFDNELPLRLALPEMQPDWLSSPGQELRVRFDGLPISWLSPFLPELDLPAGALYGELAAVTGGGAGLTLEPVEPFQLRDLTTLYRGIVATDGATVGLRPRLRLDNTVARVALEEIQMRTPSGGRLDGQVVLEASRDDTGRIISEVWFEGDFPAITGRIGRLGALSWRQRGVIDVPSRRLEVDELELGLTDLAGTRFLELEGLRPFALSLDPFGFSVDGGAPEILQATVTPLELQQLFPQVLGFQLEGVLPQGQFLGRVEDGSLVLAAEEELVFKDVSVRWDEAALLDRVTVGLTYEVVYSSEGLQARTVDFSTLGPRGTPIGDATLRAVMPLIDRSMIESLHFETLANLEPLTRQPIFDGLPAFLEGTVAGSFDLSYGDRSTLHGSLQLRDALVDGSGILPDLDAGLDVAVGEGRGLEVRAPLRLSSDSGPTDLSFDGRVRRVDDGFEFQATLAGDRIVARDVARLVDVVASSDEEPGPETRRESMSSEFRERWSKDAIAKLRERRDSEPFWGDNVTGEATLGIDRIELARASLDGIGGRLRVNPEAVELDRVEATMLGAGFAAEGGVRFDGSAEAPYRLELSSSISGIDLGRLFQAVNPDELPTLEGVFEVRTLAVGTGRNPADLGLGTLGEVRVSGRDGVFRGLAGQYGWARKGTKVVGFLTFSKQLKAVSRLLGELEALRFDRFELALARETPRRFAISELTVSSPLARIEGAGGVEVEPGVPLVESPLAASFEMSTQGDMTILFNGLGLLQEDADEHGYRPVIRPITVGGTVAEPDTSQFYEMLDEAARDSKGVLGVGMRRINKKLQKAQEAKTP